jgi:hypothetical protein
VTLASAGELERASGRLFANGRPVALQPHDGDLDSARRLWEASERLTGFAFS